jgi:hypothetical protein
MLVEGTIHYSCVVYNHGSVAQLNEATYQHYANPLAMPLIKTGGHEAVSRYVRKLYFFCRQTNDWQTFDGKG